MALKDEINAKANEYAEDLYQFLRDMIKIPSTSRHEETLIKRIKMEMEKLGYDEIKIDAFGNILGRIGSGDRVIAYDGHVDTVGIGNKSNWDYDPFDGFENDEIILGRGASDQEGGFASIVYAGKIIKDLGLAEGLTLWVVGSVGEEDCDGLCWDYILSNDVIRPEFVVLTEPTSLNVYRGHRGRMEIKVSVQGISAHGSAPHRGDNAIYKMAKIVNGLESLNENLRTDDFLGKGTLVVSEIFSNAPSRCAVADQSYISIDRRLTEGETAESALNEIKALPSVKRYEATVEMYQYDKKTYKNYQPHVDSYFPTWTLPEDHELCRRLLATYDYLFKRPTALDKWTFSTNGVSIMGKHHVPCIGFGPGHEDEAHAPNEKILKQELIDALKVYSAIPKFIKEENDGDEFKR